MTVFETAAFLYLATCVGTIGFQVALITGAPWGHLTQGGQHHGALATKNRVIAFLSIFILAGMASSIMSAAGFWPFWPSWTAWVTLALQFLIALLNWITRSKPERRLWGPITTLMLMMAAIVVFGM